MGDSSRSILDPIWEYVLDDYESDHENKRRLRKPVNRRRSQKEAQQEKEKRFDINGFYPTDSNSADDNDNRWQGFDIRDDTEDVGGAWLWGSAEEPTQKKRHPWRRDSQSSQPDLARSGSDGSMWDLFNGAEKVQEQPPSVATKSCLKPRSKYSSSSGRVDSKTDMRSTSQSDLYQNQTTTEDKPKKKSVFWRRSHSQEEHPPPSRKDPEPPLDVSTSKSKRSSSSKAEQHTHAEAETEFDPMSMFLEVADKIVDPWGSDSDSHSQESTLSGSVTSDDKRSDDRSVSSYEEREDTLHKISRAGQQLTIPTNEIRLQYTPVVHGDGDGSEGPYIHPSSVSSVDMTGAMSNLSGASIPITSSEHAMYTSNSFPFYDDERRTVTFFEKDDNSNNGTDITGSPSGDQSLTRDLDQDLFDQKQRPKLSRLVCCSAKTTAAASVSSLRNLESRDTGITDIFPMTRMISDDHTKQASIYGQEADFKNGIMGVSSDRFLETKGPQSLFAYDYDSNEHMDVIYNEFGKPAKRSLFLRKLGPPPALLASSNVDEVVVKVEASTVSETDNIIRRGGWWGGKAAPLPSTPGVDAVGKIYHIKQKACSKHGLVPQQTVLSLVKWGGNSRFLTIKPEKLVKVPEGLDPAQVACLPEMYLTAFQVLHLGQSRAMRYRNNAMKGKSILIIGFMSNNLGSAIIELALKAGVANIYATAKKKHWKKLIKYGVMPLDQDPIDWILRVEGTIDLVLATNGAMREDLSRIHYRALNSTGQMILCGHRAVGNDVPVAQWEKQFASVMCSKNKAISKMQSKSHAYDVFQSWEKDLSLCKSDLEHLLRMLETGAIAPTILDRIPLGKVPRAHTLMESKNVSGFLVCEPWMKGKQRAIYM